MRKKLLVLNVKLSGVNDHLFKALKGCGWSIDSIEVPKPKLCKYINALKTFHPVKAVWRDRFYETLGKTPLSFIMRTQFCEKKVWPIANKYDVILQIGGMYAPGFKDLSVPYVTYNDYTMKLAEREYPQWAPFTSKKQADKWYSLEEDLYNRASRVFTFSNRTRESVVNDYGAEDAKVITVGSGANLSEMPDITHRSYDENSVLFIGIDFPRKGGYVLLDAFKKVRAEIPNANLVIVGPERSSINADIPSGIEVKGLIKEREIIKDLYKKSTIFVMPSFGDPFPNVLFEAMAYKVPCIGADVSGIPEQIKDGKTGFIVPSGDSDKLAERIAQLLKNKTLCKDFGESGYRHVVENFTWEKAVSRMNVELEKLVK